MTRNNNLCVPFSKAPAPGAGGCDFGGSAMCGTPVGGHSGGCLYGKGAGLPEPGGDTSPVPTDLSTNPMTACVQPTA